MGGKTGTTTSSVSIPPEVLARYNAVNAKADVAAGQPFQQYGTDPSAFVAQLNQQQQQGISGINQYANAAQPNFNAAIGQTNQASDTIARNQYLAQPAFNAAENQTVNATQAMQGAANMAQPAFQNAMYGTQAAYGGYNPQAYQGGVQGYMNPYLQNAVGSTAAQLNNINQQQQQSLLGNAVSQGAFGGDRTNIGMANLMNQQNLAMGQTIGGMENQGYQAAAQNYMTGLSQQGALANQMGQLGAQQQAAALQGQQAVLGGADQLARLGAAQQTAALQGVPLSLNAANQVAQIGAQQQASGLQGAQAQLGAGTLGQQTEQAGKTALYNQYQQQQAYPFQVAQFLAGIAGITGPNSGSTTTTTSPTSFFSDRRLKEDIKRVGTAENGLPIYKFKYKGDPAEQTHIGFMADEVEKIHPEAVGESHGFKTVDYDRAARYAGGLVRDSEGGAVTSNHMGEGYASGGYTDPSDMASILASQQQSYAPFQQSGLYGATSGVTPGVKGYVQAPNLPVGHLVPAAPPRTGGGETLAGDIHEAANMGDDVKKLNQYRKDLMGQKAKAATATTDAQSATGLEAVKDWLSGQQQQGAYRGGLVHAYADGGDVLPYNQEDPMSDIVRNGEKDLITSKLLKPTPTSGSSSGSSTASDIGTAVNLGKDAIWLASLFSNGGRAGYEDGGSAEGDDVVGAMGPQLPNNPNYYKTRAVEIAKNVGIDPVDFVKLGQGESGFFPHSGDDNSSAGVMQNHIGGASSQFPHGGRGDEFIAKYAPDEIKNGTPEQKIAYLNARETQIPQMQDAAEYIKTHGAQPWTVAKQQGLFGATREADMPAKGGLNAQATGAQGAQGFQPPEGGTQPKSLGDMLTSENTLIPLLSGLGAMAGSKSRYLGSAILEGIGAGAKSYEDVQANIATRGLTNAQRDVQATVAGNNAQIIAQNAMYKGPDNQMYIMTSQGPMLKGLWDQSLAQGKYIPTVGYDQMVTMISRIPGAQPVNAGPSQVGAASQNETTPRQVTPVPGAGTIKQVAGAPGTEIGDSGKALAERTYNTSLVNQVDYGPKKAKSNELEDAILGQRNTAINQGNQANQLAGAILSIDPNGWNSIGPTSPLRNTFSSYWNDIVLKAANVAGYTPDQMKDYLIDPKDIGSAQAAAKIKAALSFAGADANMQHSLGALQNASAMVPSTENSYEGAVDNLSGMFVNKQKAIDQYSYLQNFKNHVTSIGGPAMQDRYLVQDALNGFALDHNEVQYGAEKERLKKILARRTESGSSYFNDLYTGKKSIRDLEKAMPGITRYMLNN